MDRIKQLLNQEISKSNINRDGFGKIQIDNTNRLLPVGDIYNIVDVAERFNLERQTSKYYRFNGTVNSLFTNVLFNTTGENSWSTFMSPIFRDKSYPPNGIDLDEEEDLTYRESIDEHLTEVNGWMGYFDPNVASFSPCLFTDMEPSREKFTLTPTNAIRNWEMVVTYPYSSINISITNGGLLIVDKKEVLISGRKMTAFGVPVKHNLIQGSTVRINGMNPSNVNGVYNVIRLGLDDGDLKLNYFCLDINPDFFNIEQNSRMVRIVNGSESDYYLRKFKKVKMRFSSEMEIDDYEIYPLAFSQNIFNDKITQFVINEDIDVSELVDNLGRPLSELYVTFIKTNSDNVFKPIKSGLDIPFIDSVDNFKIVPDIRRITNDIINTHTAISTNVLIDNDDYDGDIVEYNKYELLEVVLADVNHQFNTINRESGGSITDPITGDIINLGVRYEGMIYKPHHKIQIRNFSSYIEQGDDSVVGIPDYAENLGDGRYLWRDLLEIGFNDIQNNILDYPFLNGSHYIHKNLLMVVKRQDPFAKYGLYHSQFPRDGIGNSISNNFAVKKVDDVC